MQLNATPSDFPFQKLRTYSRFRQFPDSLLPPFGVAAFCSPAGGIVKSSFSVTKSEQARDLRPPGPLGSAASSLIDTPELYSGASFFRCRKRELRQEWRV